MTSLTESSISLGRLKRQRQERTGRRSSLSVSRTVWGGEKEGGVGKDFLFYYFFFFFFFFFFNFSSL